MLKQLAFALAIATPAWGAAQKDLPKLEGNYTFSEDDTCWRASGPAFFEQVAGQATFSTEAGTVTEKFGEVYISDGTAKSERSKGTIPFKITGEHAISLGEEANDYVQFGSLNNGTATSAIVLALYQDDSESCIYKNIYTQMTP